MFQKILYWTCALLFPLYPLLASNAYDKLPRGKVGTLSEEIRQEVLSCRDMVSTYCGAHPKVLDVFDRLFLTMAAEGAFRGGLGDYYRLLNAVTFAAYHHRGQIRKCQERLPYIIHPLGVAYLLWTLGEVHETHLLMAAVLHDVIEDTEATYQDIEETFGSEIAGIVAEVTDDKGLPYEERKAYQIAHAPFLSHEAKLVKLADKLYNICDVGPGQVIIWVGDRPYPWSDDRVLGYLQWAESVFHGLLGTNEQLELSLKTIFEEARVQASKSKDTDLC